MSRNATLDELISCEIQLSKLQERSKELRQQLGLDGDSTDAPKKRAMSEEGRKRIAAAQKQRWAKKSSVVNGDASIPTKKKVQWTPKMRKAASERMKARRAAGWSTAKRSTKGAGA